LQDFWTIMTMALGGVVFLLGLLISLVGLLVGVLGGTWVGLAAGLGVLAVGGATWVFPFVHLSLRFRRFSAELERIASSSVVGKGIAWKSVKGPLFTVAKFAANASVTGNTVRASSVFEPYAWLTMESPGYDGPILMPVLHRLDFLHLWRVFHERSGAGDEEVIVTYDPDRWFGKFMPHLPIMVAPKNTLSELALIEGLKPVPTSDWLALMRSIRKYWDPPHPGRDLHASLRLWWRSRKSRRAGS
jgi:hypothetical protein